MTAFYQNVIYAKNPLLPKIKNAICPLMHSHKVARPRCSQVVPLSILLTLSYITGLSINVYFGMLEYMGRYGSPLVQGGYSRAMQNTFDGTGCLLW